MNSNRIDKFILALKNFDSAGYHRQNYDKSPKLQIICLIRLSMIYLLKLKSIFITQIGKSRVFTMQSDNFIDFIVIYKTFDTGFLSIRIKEKVKKTVKIT